ncbi:glycerophosphoryl diester phosphodiesterase [Desulfocapsa sulfexigens DSM 10523]|uniref:glycerophosphodiester phosphodiesterase n=1 Tax=Desulfocapsa sulfexigens (strain DSM 10523 / SB164P1) TaxID=1167006 RepID=M1PNZ0_DESSD|nr:glycerophosphodiester phosphodiesterase [Desulfocapsa sulfexigens]AGF78141.1 glycerophosphoryl diester phosphodiesterase [Desulfocapsa sulfexigens DSM 10523]
MRYLLLLLKRSGFFLILTGLVFPSSPATAKLVIAQGGASGYLMEHSLPAIAMAIVMDTDIVKIDTVLSADNEVIVAGSPRIQHNTNVGEIFPDRKRDDGQFYALDLTLEEIRQLTLRDPAGRFPEDLQLRLTIPTLEEVLSLVEALNKSLEKNTRIAIELKQTWLHRKEGRDLSSPVLRILQQYGYSSPDDTLLLMSYDAAELSRIKKELLPEMGMDVKLVQLIESNEGQENMTEEWGEWNSYNYDWMFSKSGLRSLTSSVAAIGLPKHMLADSEGKLLLDDFVKNAQQLGTMIFTFPIEKDTAKRVPFVQNFNEELEFFYFTVGVDGVITAFCKNSLEYLKNREAKPATILPLDEAEVVPPSVEIISGDPLQLTSPLESQFKE